MDPSFPLSESLRSRFDYYYAISSPQPSLATNYYDNQAASLFGDPVPPPSSSSIADSLNSQLYHSFTRHIDQKMALSYQKADLWYNNKNIYKPKPSTASYSESPSISTIDVPRAKTAMVKRKSAVRKDHSMISTLDENYRQPSFTRLDYSSDSSANATTSNNFYALSPNTSSSDNLRAPTFAAKSLLPLPPPLPPKQRRRIERPNVTSVTVRPYTQSTMPSTILGRLSESSLVDKTQFTSSEDDREPTSPLPAIIRDKVLIGSPYRCEEGRTHKRPAFSILNNPEDIFPDYESLRLNETRSRSASSTTSEPSPRHLTLDGVSDTKFGARRAHDFTILRSKKSRVPLALQRPGLGKSRRDYHQSLPTLWKRAGHDTRVMHDRKKLSDASCTSSLNPSRTQKGMLRVMSSGSSYNGPPPICRSKSAIKFPITMKHTADQRRAKSQPPSLPSKKTVNIKDEKKRDVKRVSKPTNLSPIAGGGSESEAAAMSAKSARSRGSASSKKTSAKTSATTSRFKALARKDSKDDTKTKPKPKPKPKEVTGKEKTSAKKPIPGKSATKKPEEKRKPTAKSKPPPSGGRRPVELQKSTSSMSMKKQSSSEKEGELNKSQSFRSDRKGMTSATSTASNTSKKSMFSIGKLKSFASRKNNSRSKIDEEEGGKSVASKGPVAKALEKKASRSELKKMSSRDSILSNTGDSTSSRRTNQSGSSLSLARAPISDETTTAALAAHSSNVTATVTEQLAKDIEDGPPMTPADTVILEKSKKTLESIQRTVSDAADEIQKTIEENLSDLNTLENAMRNNSAKSSRATPAKGDTDVKTTASRIVSQKSFDNESNNNTNNSVNLIDVENNNVLPLSDSFERDDGTSMKSAMKSVKSEMQEKGSTMTDLDTISPMDNEMPSTSQQGQQESGRNPKACYQTLQRIEKMMKQENFKILFYPEGTRSMQDGFLPFKKGAFTTAIQAQVPVFPIVYCPYYYYDDKAGVFLYDNKHHIISYLKPISTKGMTEADVDDLKQEVHDVMLQEYEQLKEEVEIKSKDPSWINQCRPRMTVIA